MSSRRYSESQRPSLPDRTKNLLRYYIECVRQDEGQSVDPSLDDVGKKFIPWPFSSDLSFMDDSGLSIKLKQDQSNFANELSKSTSHGSLLYGYPTYIDVNSARVIPLFTWPVDYEISGWEMLLRITPEWPQINPSYLSRLAPTGDDQMKILASLDLLDTMDDPPDYLIVEILNRMEVMGFLQSLREQINPQELSSSSRKKGFDRPGIHNCAALFLTNPPTYTRGLIRDLTDMVECNSPGWKNTAFGTVMGERKIISKEEHAPIEVVPLNEEQRQAVRKAMSSPFTVVTGPPGTGKSQIVVSMIADAYMRGESVLFTSKNNKAVDVVEDRVSSLSTSPLMIRTGNRVGDRNLRQELSNRLASMLAFQPSDFDRQEYKDLRVRYKVSQSQQRELWSELQNIRLANSEVLALYEAQQRFSSEYTPHEWEQLQAAKTLKDRGSFTILKNLIDKHLDREVGLLRRFSLRISASRDRKRIRNLTAQSVQECPVLGPLPTDNQSFQSWQTWVTRSVSKIAAVEAIASYKDSLAALRELRSRDEVARQLRRVQEEIADSGARLVYLFARLSPDRINLADRQAIGNFRALQERLAGDQLGGREYARLRGEMARLFEDVSRHISAWCVTNLSASSNLELEPSMFDLLIIDEASQCDIASALPLLYRSKRAVIIGDANQLRHITKIKRHRDQQLQAEYHLSANDQAFAFSQNSLYDLAITRRAPIQLQDHYRSHADITSFSNRQWYQDSLRVWTDYRRLKRPPDGHYGIRWTEISGSAIKPRGGSVYIPSEAEEVVNQVVNLLMNQKFDGTVGVVTPFRPQKSAILERVVQQVPADVFNRAQLIVDTAHGFQGDERDIVYFSPCVSSDLPDGARGFLKNTSNLFNVTITRARSLLHVVGSKSASAHSGIPHIESFVSYCTAIESTGTSPYETSLASDERIGPWERPLYEALVAKGLNPIPQHSVNQYRLDLAIVHGNMRVDIEVDGESTHVDPRLDAERDSRLENLGWRVVRFWNRQVRDDIDYCVQTILELLEQPSPRTPPPLLRQAPCACPPLPSSRPPSRNPSPLP